jgi:hypothetical protein
MMLQVILMLAAASMDTEHSKPLEPSCSLTNADREANARLSFEEFDQQGKLPSTWRALGNAGCRTQAIDALKDYVIHGPVQEPYHQRILLFHLGQTLASYGQESQGAEFIAFSREPKGSRPKKSTLNWNDYVVGTWAFLTKDWNLLVKSRRAVFASSGQGNQINGAILEGLERCFDKPYSVAYDPDCGRTRQ